MIVELEEIALDRAWRFGVVAAEVSLREASGVEEYHIDGRAVRCLRSFHEEVAADFFFASHYCCDPHAPLDVLAASPTGTQSLVWWHHADGIASDAPDDWQAILQMFRAAMATLHPQGRYLRLLFPTDDAARLLAALHGALDDAPLLAGVGFDYETGHSQLDILHEAMYRPRPKVE